MSTSASSKIEICAAIEAALHSYCRGIDRLNAAAIQAAFHPDATLEGYGTSALAPIDLFVPRVLVSLRERFIATQHRLSNIAVEIDGDSALVESYVLAYHVADVDGQRSLSTFNGRYIDHFEVRDGQWLIARRMLRMDWSDTSPLGPTMAGEYIFSGRDGSPDPIFA